MLLQRLKEKGVVEKKGRVWLLKKEEKPKPMETKVEEKARELSRFIIKPCMVRVKGQVTTLPLFLLLET